MKRMAMIFRIIICSSAVALFLSCARITADSFVGKDNAISFMAPETETKAAVDTKDNLTDFNVWGWHTVGGSGSSQIFDATVIHKDAGWDYTDGTRFWILGETYDFYALHPAITGGTVSYDREGNLSVTGFDCSGTGEDAIDLMTACSNGIQYDENNRPQPVSLEFSHELARLKFIVKSENTSVTVENFKVYGFGYKGNLSKQVGSGTIANWDVTSVSSETATPFEVPSFELNRTAGMEKDVFGDILVIPGNELTDAEMYIEYRYLGESTSQSSTISLNTSTTSKWEAGKSYRYILTVKGGQLTVNVSIDPWDEENTSVSWQ